MNEFPWVKKFWEWCCKTWRTSFGAVVAVVVAFFFGAAWGVKSVVDDCKFSGVFRDGHVAYNCSMRLR